MLAGMDFPLPSHLLMPIQLGQTLLQYQRLNAACASARNGSPGWNGQAWNLPLWSGLPNPAAPWLESQKSEQRKRIEACFAGARRYLDAPATTMLRSIDPIWQEGTTRLLDYGGRGMPLLIIPSLINRYYILDLTPQTSIVAYLKKQGYRPFIVDWSAPGEQERSFGIDDYVTQRLLPMLAHVQHATSQKPVVIGYCMGGMLALALSQLKQADIRALALLATPWDHHADDVAFPHRDTRLHANLLNLLDPIGALPSVVIQSLFALASPLSFEQRFSKFAGYDSGSAQARLFVELERWTEDGVSLAAPVTRECITQWWQQNLPYRHRWKILGETINPSRVALPAFLAIPQNDRIVSAQSALALANVLPNATLQRPAAGHVGMIVGSGAHKGLWEPMARWLSQLPR